MNTKIYEFVLERLKDSKGSWPEVARGSRVSKRTIEKIARQEVKDPGVKVVQKLAEYFSKQARVH